LATSSSTASGIPNQAGSSVSSRRHNPPEPDVRASIRGPRFAPEVEDGTSSTAACERSPGTPAVSQHPLAEVLPCLMRSPSRRSGGPDACSSDSCVGLPPALAPRGGRGVCPARVVRHARATELTAQRHRPGSGGARDCAEFLRRSAGSHG
jgi:hypothetical protein